MYTYNHKCFSYYNGSIDKAYWFYNKSDDEKFSSGRFFDFEYKKVLHLIWWKGGTSCFYQKALLPL